MLVATHTGSLRGRLHPGAIGKLKRMTVVAASASPAFWDRAPRPRPSGRRVLVAAAVVALVAVAAALRLRALSAPYWIDEGISVGISSHPLGAIPGVLRQDGSPPLYYLLLHVWMALFGSAPSATHALSAGLAIACVPAAWWAVAPFGTWAGLVAGGLMALDPFVGLYADETRMYSLLLLIGLLVCGAFLRAFVLRRRAHLASFAILLALALYAHPWGAFLVGAAGVAWLALLVVGPSRRTLARDGALAFGGAALLFAPWVPTLLYQAAHTGAPWSHRPTGRSLTRALARIWSGRRAELVLLPAAAVGLAIGALRGGRRARRGVLGVAVIGAATLLAAFAYSRFGTPAWALRYLVVVLAPLALLVALGLGRLALLGPLAVLAASLFAWHGRPTVATLEHKSNVTQVARALAPALAARHARLLHPARAGARARARAARRACATRRRWGGRRRRGHGLARRAGAPGRRSLRRGPRSAAARAAPRRAPAHGPARVQPPRLAVDAEDPRHRAPMGPRGAPQPAAASAAAGASYARQLALDGGGHPDGAPVTTVSLRLPSFARLPPPGRGVIVAAVLAVVVIAAAALRVEAAGDRPGHASADERAYVRLASDLRATGNYGGPSMAHPLHWAPGAPALFAVADAIGGHPVAGSIDARAARRAQAVVGALTVGAAFALAALIAGAWAGVVAAVAVAFYPPMIAATTQLTSEPLGALALTAALAAVAWAWSRGRAAGFAAAGAAVGLACLVRADVLLAALVLAPAVGLLHARRARLARRSRHRLRDAASACWRSSARGARSRAGATGPSCRSPTEAPRRSSSAPTCPATARSSASSTRSRARRSACTPRSATRPSSACPRRSSSTRWRPATRGSRATPRSRPSCTATCASTCSASPSPSRG